MNRLFITQAGTFEYDYEQALAATAEQRAAMPQEVKIEIINILEQRSSINKQLTQKTNDLFTCIFMVAKIEQTISALQTSEMEEYAIALFLLKMAASETRFNNQTPDSMFPTPPPLTLQLIKTMGKVDRTKYNHNDVIGVLKSSGYTNLGWRNDGIEVPTLTDWTEVYRNDTASWTVTVSHSNKLYYCTDMGD